MEETEATNVKQVIVMRHDLKIAPWKADRARRTCVDGVPDASTAEFPFAASR